MREDLTEIRKRRYGISQEEWRVDIDDIMAAVKKYLILILAFVIAGGAGGMYMASNVITPQYEATVTYYVVNSDSKNAEKISSYDITASQLLLNTYISILQSSAVLGDVADWLNSRDGVVSGGAVTYTVEDLKERMTAEWIMDTEVFSVTVRHADPEEAVEISNKIASVSAEKIPEYVEGSSMRFYDTALVPSTPVEPSKMKLLVIGMFIGGMIGAIIMFFRELVNKKINDESEIVTYFDIPVLGSIEKM